MSMIASISIPISLVTIETRLDSLTMTALIVFDLDSVRPLLTISASSQLEKHCQQQQHSSLLSLHCDLTPRSHTVAGIASTVS